MSPLARRILDRAAAITRQRMITGPRVDELKRLAEDTARAYRAERLAKDRAAIDRSAAAPVPPEHIRLRQMLLGIARGDRDSPKLLPPPRKTS